MKTATPTDLQWASRAVASELVAQAIDILKSNGMVEHDAISALEDALETRRLTYNIARD